MSGWPDPARPGVPLNPERDGWHWVGNVVREWLAEFQMWQDRHGYCVKPETWGVLPYGAPCLTPAEVGAREAAAFKRGAEAMREKAAAHLNKRASALRKRDADNRGVPDSMGVSWVADDLDAEAASIRALPIPEDKA